MFAANYKENGGSRQRKKCKEEKEMTFKYLIIRNQNTLSLVVLLNGYETTVK